MKIVFLTRFFYPHVGGVEKHVLELSRKLTVKGHNVVVVTTKYENSLPEKEKLRDLEIVRFVQPRIKFFGLFYTWIWFLKNRKLLLENDALHVHDVFNWYLPMRFIFPSKKIYTTFHGWETIYPIPLSFKSQKKLASVLSEKTIAVGKYIEKYYEISADAITYGAADTPKTRKENKKYKEIVYVGRLDPDTGLPLFLKALEKISGYNVVFCGDGSLRSECEKFGRVLTFVDPQKYIERAKFCFVSGYLSILESLANKCLTIAAYENSLKKDYFYLSPFMDYIFVVNHPDEIVKIINSIDSYKDQVEKGYNFALEQSWEKLSKQYLYLWSGQIKKL